MTNPLLGSISGLPMVSRPAAVEYSTLKNEIVAKVDSIMESRDDIFSLIGGNQVSTMRVNHANHAGTMAVVFLYNRFDLLALAVPWVYRTYISHGFSTEYFPLLFQTFITSIERTVSPGAAGEIMPVYLWLLENHETILRTRFDADEIGLTSSPEREAERVAFRDALLTGDHGFCLRAAEKDLAERGGIRDLYVHILQPSLYDIGRMWERGEVSVAEEHLASAVAGRVMSALYARIASSERTKRTCVVTAVPNEHHEIGARMVADLLEEDGWSVYYLGSNIELSSAVSFIKERNPFLVAVSVALPFTLQGAAELISEVKSDPFLADVRFMAGGLAFSGAGDLWKSIGADGYARDASEAVELARQWFSEGDRRRSGQI
ncbi:MAG: cobalamin-dependent protein [Thermovirgaceae bacterium]|nr:cobalamin-dependent protein [Synergistales bacterium]MDY0179074.1 cobalamin-dependent protein [Synergistaceae bacterium]HRW87641.1 cobalamin-dependent protein [Thermovirgaceae bacterium]MDD3830079.1 cobalamin-dependent protein [Synergistales bacterium]MDD4022817.1 cobalamin-dependent protein [Synergistales bacterium]